MIFIQRAKKEAQSRFRHVPDQDLSYFAEGSTRFDDYLEAVQWAQNPTSYAAKAILNRFALAHMVQVVA